ncbi:glutathione S-transferase 1 [Spodoptera frugiperda]|uniref:Glutathione S-transferase 1 n=1 Tax=Spodoptera frugiperda TaxID=7108 RepID=A0A9R0E5U1_SPOFR|nr:glutathione S-transferase 1 [Spodoptera frugiperda]
MAPILYKVDASPPANALRILSEIIGLELEVRDVNFGALEHKSPEYLKRNPMGTIPTLVDGDFVISESHATMKYLLSVYGGDKSESLYPSDVRTRAIVDQCIFFNVGIFFIRLKVIVLPAIFGDLDGPTEKHKADIDEAYGIVEAYLAKNKYLAADHLTIADLSVGATTISMQPLHKLDAAKFPLTAAWMARLEEHPSVQKYLVPGAKILGDIVNAAWDKNKKK